MAPPARADAGAVKSGSWRTAPVNQSAAPRFEGCEPARVTFMTLLPVTACHCGGQGCRRTVSSPNSEVTTT